ncbi:MAG: sel1 repeat family protein [Magnetococcales bacterium]|nr:sel1 repeat family protein [Magnetococcales bacterium]
MLPPAEQIDPERYLALVHSLAEGGNVKAQHNLGAMYLKGLGVPRDPKRAAAWFIRAAGGGEILSMHNLGTMHLQGLGVERSPALALDWFRRAARAGDARSAHCLGALYFEGLGVERDPVRALLWLRRAEAGIPEAFREEITQAVELARGELDEASLAYVEERLARPGEDD